MKHPLRLFVLLLMLFMSSVASAEGDGYGANNGGNSGTAVTVTTAAQLASYAGSNTAYNITVLGTIDFGTNGSFSVGSNTTIQGANSSATIKGTITINGVSNVIIKNLNITANTGGAGDNDGITIRGGATGILVTKCNIYDCTDGLLDVTHGGGTATISWCKFYYTRDNGHNFSCLIGASNTDAGTYKLTYHHNWWAQGCQQRMAAARFGPTHFYNNYFSCAGNYYCTTSRNVGEMLAQNNYYNGVSNPLDKVESGKLKTSGNVFNNCTGSQVTSNDAVFTPPYTYSLTSANSVPSEVQAGAGNVFTSASAFSTIQAESYSSMSGVQTETCSEGGLNVGYINSGDWIRISGVNFGSGANGFSARVASNGAGGTITLRIDGTSGTQIGTCAVSNTGGWQTWANANGNVSGATGTHDLYLMFSGASGYLFNLNHFSFTAGSGNYVRLQNRGTGLFLDGMGRTVNGDACGQYGNTSHVNAQWEVIDVGSGYSQLRNVGTGLYLDGMGLTANGSDCGQYANTTHVNSHWSLQQYSGVYYRIQNRGTGLFIDGMGRTANGDAAGQYANTSHVNAQWQMITASGSRQAGAEVALSESFKLFPNPTADVLNIDLGQELTIGAGVVIYDNAGKQVFAAKLISSKTPIDVSNFKTGIYIVKSTNNDKTFTSKFLKK
jgi:pectate lyase